MKIKQLGILLLVSALALTGCHSNEPTERPNWKAVPTDYYGSMSIILDAASLPADMDSQDITAAFIGEICRGVKSPYLEQDSVMRIYLSVKPSEQEAVAAGQSVVLRYYSTKQQRIYESNPIPYADEEMLGTMSQGYKPVWKQ